MTSGISRSADFAKYSGSRKFGWKRREERIELLSKRPKGIYAVVGTIEIRTSRPKSAEALSEELRRNASRLDADAVLPAPLEHPREVVAPVRLNPLQPFYVFDDGHTQILEAQAIRFAPVSTPKSSP